MDQFGAPNAIDPSLETVQQYYPQHIPVSQPPHEQHLDPALTSADNHASPNLQSSDGMEGHLPPEQDGNVDSPSTSQNNLQDLGQPEQATFTELEDLITHLQTHAKDHGFALVRSTLRRRESDKQPILLNLLCDRHGHLRNHRGLTEETRVRKKRKSRGIGCPYRISCTLRSNKEKKKSAQSARKTNVQSPVIPMHPQRQSQPGPHGSQNDAVMPGEGYVGTAIMTPQDSYNQLMSSYQASMPMVQSQSQLPTAPEVVAAPEAPEVADLPEEPETEFWIFKVTSTSHNHGPEFVDGEPHWKHRRITDLDMKRIRQWFIDGRSPRDMLDTIKGDTPDCPYQLKDVQNARRKAKTQFEDYLEGRLPGQ